MSTNCIICLVCIGKLCNQIYGCFIGRISIVNELYYLYCSDIAPSGSLSLASTQTLLDAAFLLMMMLVSLLPVLMMMIWMDDNDGENNDEGDVNDDEGDD